MSRSSPPPSPTAGKAPLDDFSGAPDQAGPPPSPSSPLKRRLNLRLAALMRWTHIYLSMFSLATLWFFSVTGITLNHPDWFFDQAERNTQAQGQLNVKWLNLEVPGAAQGTSVGDRSNASEQ